MSSSEMVGLPRIRFLGVVLWRSWVVWEGGIFLIIEIDRASAVILHKRLDDARCCGAK